MFAVDNTKDIIFNFVAMKMTAFSRTRQLKDSIMNIIAAPHCSTGSCRCWVEMLQSPTLTGPANTATNGRFERGNPEALEQLRQADREVLSASEHSFRDREFRASGNG